MKKNLLGISLITISCLYVLLSAIIILVTIVVGYPPIYGIGISIIVLLLQSMLLVIMMVIVNTIALMIIVLLLNNGVM